MLKYNLELDHKQKLYAFRRPLAIAVAAVYTVVVGVLVYLALEFENLPGELQLTMWMQSWHPNWLEETMEAISAPGARTIGVFIVSLTAAFLYLKGLRKEAGLILVTTASASIITNVIKVIIDRPRPAPDMLQTYHEYSNYSFPSGHVMTYVVFLATLAIVVTWNMRPCAVRRLILGSLVFGMISVGVSRVYLGAHFPSDVIAGYAFSAAIVVSTVVLARRWAKARRQDLLVEALN